MPTAIEWTDETWQVTHGCRVVSPGCTNCYAMRMARRLELMGQKAYAGLTQQTKAGAVWNGVVRAASEKSLMLPFSWKKPRRVFVDSMADLFAEGVEDEWIDRAFAVIALNPRHTFQVLTKRPERMRAWFAEKWQGTAAFPDLNIPAGKPTGRSDQVEQAMMDMADARGMLDPDNDDHWTPDGRSKVLDTFQWPLPNVWLGTSVEDQTRADERIPHLLATPAAVRFLSCEPLLGPLHLRLPVASGGLSIDWVITGGESGPGFRHVDDSAFRSIRDQCRAAGVAIFHKQQPGKRPIPADLKVREMPAQQ